MPKEIKSDRGIVLVNIEDVNAAKKYAGFNEDTDPNDYDERYFRANDCNQYDAFMAGIEYYKNK